MSLIVYLLVWIVGIGLGAAALTVALPKLLGVSLAASTNKLLVTGGIVGITAGAAAVYLAARATGVAGPQTADCAGIVTRPVDPQAADTRARMIECGNTLTFATNEHGAADMQFLDLADPNTGQAVPGGPLAGIFPQADIHRNSMNALANGRIVARIWVEDTARTGYAKLGLGPGWNYVWIDGTNPPPGQAKQPSPGTPQRPRLGLEGPARRGVYRAVIVPENTAFPVVVRPVDYYDHRGKPWWPGLWPRALARWTFWPDDADAWMNCTKHGCCDIGGE